MVWLIFALITSICYGAQMTCSYYLSLKNIDAFSINYYFNIIFTIIVTIILIIGNFLKYKIASNITSNLLFLIKDFFSVTLIASFSRLVGNICIYEAFKLPSNINPGVITGLTNTSVIITSILAVMFFNKTLNPWQIFGIVLIILSCFLLTKISRLSVDKKSENNDWIGLSFIAALSYGVFNFLEFYILEKTHVNALSIVVLISIQQVLLSYFIEKITRNRISKNNSQLLNSENFPLLVSGSLLDGIGITFLLSSYLTSPNPGLSDALANTYPITQIIIMYFLEKYKITKIQIIGFILTIIGIFFSSKNYK